MSIASSANVLLNEMEQAEKDLALYAAIIGHKPTMSADAPRIEMPTEMPTAMPSVMQTIDNAARALADSHTRSHPAEPGKISIWMRHVSHEAKKRIHEAAMRLAS